MEIAFRLCTQPGRLWHLDEALAKQPSETLSTLVKAIGEAIFAHKVGGSTSLLLPMLRAIELQEHLFRQALENLDFKWELTLKEQWVMLHASGGRYEDGTLEANFYNHGGLEGILVLILFFRSCEDIQPQWNSIVKEYRPWFVGRVAKMLCRDIVEWVPQYFKEIQARRKLFF